MSCPTNNPSLICFFQDVFIFQEAKESIDEEDPRLTSSNGAYITSLNRWEWEMTKKISQNIAITTTQWDTTLKIASN